MKLRQRHAEPLLDASRKVHVKRVINGLMKVRSDYDHYGTESYVVAYRTADAIFGPPTNCQWCGTDLHHRSGGASDLDRHFCANCCPICNGWPDERD